MPLKLQLRKGQKIIVNGAVLENAGSHTASLLVKNDASILRDNDILTPADARTPASRVYYALQCAYLFPVERDRHLGNLKQLVDSYEEAAPSASPICGGIRSLMGEDKLYQALKLAQELIAHERQVFEYVHGRIGEEIRDATPGGKSSGGRGLGIDAGGAADEGGSGG